MTDKLSDEELIQRLARAAHLQDDETGEVAWTCRHAIDRIATLAAQLSEANGYMVNGQPMTPAQMFAALARERDEARAEIEETETAWERSQDIVTGQYRVAVNAFTALRRDVLLAIEPFAAHSVAARDLLEDFYGATDNEPWEMRVTLGDVRRLAALHARLS